MIINFGGCRDCRQGARDNTSCKILVACSFVHWRVRLQITPPNFRANPPESRFWERAERERERDGVTSKNLQRLLRFLTTAIDWSEIGDSRNPMQLSAAFLTCVSGFHSVVSVAFGGTSRQHRRYAISSCRLRKTEKKSRDQCYQCQI